MTQFLLSFFVSTSDNSTWATNHSEVSLRLKMSELNTLTVCACLYGYYNERCIYSRAVGNCLITSSVGVCSSEFDCFSIVNHLFVIFWTEKLTIKSEFSPNKVSDKYTESPKLSKSLFLNDRNKSKSRLLQHLVVLIAFQAKMTR